MATYKVIQDIEAEDKLLGPLTLKQCIYAIIVVVFGFVAFKLATSAWYLAIPFLPPMLVFGVLAAPLGRDQPTEIWLVAKLRFFLKPRRRVWNQDGQVDLVSISVPKKIDPASYTNNLSQTEVKSRLKALSDTIDSRGWAVKNISTNLFANPTAAPQVTAPPSDRLLDITTTPTPAPTKDLSVKVDADEDILDEENNPVAQQLDQMIKASTTSHRQQTLRKMQQIRERLAQVKRVRADSGDIGPSNWFTGQKTKQSVGGNDAFTSQSFSASTAAPSQQADEDILDQASDLKIKQSVAFNNLPAIPASNNSYQPSPKQGNPVILGLANNDDLNVATIARQASQNGLPHDEVSISLR